MFVEWFKPRNTWRCEGVFRKKAAKQNLNFFILCPLNPLPLPIMALKCSKTASEPSFAAQLFIFYKTLRMTEVSPGKLNFGRIFQNTGLAKGSRLTPPYFGLAKNPHKKILRLKFTLYVFSTSWYTLGGDFRTKNRCPKFAIFFIKFSQPKKWPKLGVLWHCSCNRTPGMRRTMMRTCSTTPGSRQTQQRQVSIVLTEFRTVLLLIFEI